MFNLDHLLRKDNIISLMFIEMSFFICITFYVMDYQNNNNNNNINNNNNKILKRYVVCVLHINSLVSSENMI